MPVFRGFFLSYTMQHVGPGIETMPPALEGQSLTPVYLINIYLNEEERFVSG